VSSVSIQRYLAHAGKMPIRHLTEMDSGEIVAPGSPETLPGVHERRSAVDHFALAAESVTDAVQRLTAHKIPYPLTEVPSVGELHIFCRDPRGTGVELIFPLGNE
jgi:hypothetical protein